MPLAPLDGDGDGGGGGLVVGGTRLGAESIDEVGAGGLVFGLMGNEPSLGLDVGTGGGTDGFCGMFAGIGERGTTSCLPDIIFELAESSSLNGFQGPDG